MSSCSVPIIHCSDINQLSEFITLMISKIWTTHTNCTFKSFCQNMIKTTQISNSCILVALYYIYQLRFTYPTIRPSVGSEIRLFTTALILASKFLDDNTFTNKTWSDVSCVPLVELNIMEMEFLSALQYKTRINHVQFFSWASQCQYWMYQLLNKPKKISRYQPYPQRQHYLTPNSIATFAAATAAMNYYIIPTTTNITPQQQQ